VSKTRLLNSSFLLEKFVVRLELRNLNLTYCKRLRCSATGRTTAYHVVTWRWRYLLVHYYYYL